MYHFGSIKGSNGIILITGWEEKNSPVQQDSKLKVERHLETRSEEKGR